MSWENEMGSFALGDFAVEKGGVIREARLAWQRFGTLNDKRDNLILYPSSYSARLSDMSWLIGPEGILVPTRWCIIAVGMFSDGESSGAAETPDYPALVTVADNVRAQYCLVTEVVSVDKLAAVYGFSMGGMQAYHWAALYPEMVERAFVVCGKLELIPAQQGTCFFYLVGYHQHFTKTAWQRRTLRQAGSAKIRLLETGSRA